MKLHWYNFTYKLKFNLMMMIYNLQRSKKCSKRVQAQTHISLSPLQYLSQDIGKEKKLTKKLKKWKNLPEIVQKLQKAGEIKKRKRFTKFSPKKFVFLGGRVDLKLNWALRLSRS